MIPPPSWRFLIDENMPYSLADRLRQLGCQAQHIYDLGMRSAKDPVVYSFAQAQQLTIITGDKDFSNRQMYPPPHAGLIVVRIPDTLPPADRNRLILSRLSQLYSRASLHNLLVIIEPTRLRIR